MQLSSLQQHRRNPAPSFLANHTVHTPRVWEITAVSPPSQSLNSGSGSDMFGGPVGMSIGAGPLYTNAIMGQFPSAHEREQLRKASSSILREDSIQQQWEENTSFTDDRLGLPLSRPDSYSIHYDCTHQLPYSSKFGGEDEMMTQTSRLHLPRDNASHDLAFFLRTTGPTAPHRKPSKVEHQPRRAVSAPRHALSFLKLRGGHRQQTASIQTAHERLNGVLRDEGGLLLPKGVEQKVSSTGKKYLAVRGPHDEDEDRLSDLRSVPSILSPDILESRVSVCFHEDTDISDVVDDWLSFANNKHRRSTVGDQARPAMSYDEVASRLARGCPIPIRPAASNPPTPVPESAVSGAESYRGSMYDHSLGQQSFDTSRALSSHPMHGDAPRTPKISLSMEEFPVKHPSPDKEVEIKHPLPRRFASHPVLLQRASSIQSTLYPVRSVSDSPGPPPPRSPLRLRRDPRTIEHIIASHEGGRKGTPKVAPSIKSVNDFNFDMDPIRATVTTECTGPIKRPKSRNTKENSPRRNAYPLTRKEREDRNRSRRLRDRPTVNRTIDSVVHAPVQATRQRLKKLRPQIQIPDLRPPPLRAPSIVSHASASSAASWKKVTQSTLTPVSPVPSLASEESGEDKTGYTPISPTASREAKALQTGMERSPFMLVAEQVPVSKIKSTPKPAKLILKEGKSYAPRPRSASIPRIAAKRRSRTTPQNSGHNSIHSSPRSKSPAIAQGEVEEDEEEEVPPLPSPPPTRALPPTPPAPGTEKTSKANSKAKLTASLNIKEHLPALPSHDVSPIESCSSGSGKQQYPHIATQRTTSGYFRASNRAASRIDARLEALEKQNALLSAALMAVLKTNGALNGPIPGLTDGVETERGPMAWEARVTRRSEALTNSSHTASSSNGSALDMYMNTRRGSRHG